MVDQQNPLRKVKGTTARTSGQSLLKAKGEVARVPEERDCEPHPLLSTCKHLYSNMPVKTNECVNCLKSSLEAE